MTLRAVSKERGPHTELVYTICPVLVASHVAVVKGWLEKELARRGGSARYLWSLPSENWLSQIESKKSSSLSSSTATASLASFAVLLFWR